MLPVALVGTLRERASMEPGQLREDGPGFGWQQSIDAATADDGAGELGLCAEGGTLRISPTGQGNHEASVGKAPFAHELGP